MQETNNLPQKPPLQQTAVMPRYFYQDGYDVKENDIVSLHDYSLLPQEILTLIFKYLSIKQRCQMAR